MASHCTAACRPLSGCSSWVGTGRPALVLMRVSGGGGGRFPSRPLESTFSLALARIKEGAFCKPTGLACTWAAVMGAPPKPGELGWGAPERGWAASGDSPERRPCTHAPSALGPPLGLWARSIVTSSERTDRTRLLLS